MRILTKWFAVVLERLFILIRVGMPTAHWTPDNAKTWGVDCPGPWGNWLYETYDKPKRGDVEPWPEGRFSLTF